MRRLMDFMFAVSPRRRDTVSGGLSIHRSAPDETLSVETA